MNEIGSQIQLSAENAAQANELGSQADSAAETSELIEGSVAKTRNGALIAERTAGALDEIVTGITRVTDLVSEIAAASNEQAQGISQISQGLNQLDPVTQRNTASAEESAAAAEELSGQSIQLREMLQRFTLRQAATLSPAVPRVAALRQTQVGWSQATASPAAPFEERSAAIGIALDAAEFGKY